MTRSPGSRRGGVGHGASGRCAGRGARGRLGGAGDRRIPRAARARVSGDAGSRAAAGGCGADARRLRPAAQRARRSTGQARLAIDVLKQGWASVQVPAGHAGARRAHRRPPDRARRGQPAARAHLARRPLDAHARRRRAARLRGGDRVDDAAGVGSALSAVTLVVPRTGVDLAVSGGFIAEQSRDAEPTAAGSSTATRAVRCRSLEAQGRRSPRSALPLRTRARVTELVALGEDATQVTSSIQIDVTQGLARERGRRAAGRARRQPGRRRRRRRLERRPQ